MVREPVERAYSAHRHELARGFETEPFEQAVELEAERIAGEVEQIMADPTYESFHHRHHAYLARSRYSEQVQRFIDALGPDRVYVVDADAFFTDPEPSSTGCAPGWVSRPGSPRRSSSGTPGRAVPMAAGAARAAGALLRAVRRTAGRADGAHPELAEASAGAGLTAAARRPGAPA